MSAIRSLKNSTIIGFAISSYVSTALADLVADPNGNSTAFGRALNDVSVALAQNAGNTISTTNPGDIVVVFVNNEHISADGCFSTVASVTGAGIVFHFRVRNQIHPDLNSSWDNQEEWWGYAAAPLTNIAVTASVPQCSGHNFEAATINAFAASGFTGTDYITDPFDPNPSLPALAVQTNGSSTVPTVSYSITKTQPMGVAGYASATGATNGSPTSSSTPTLWAASPGSNGEALAPINWSWNGTGTATSGNNGNFTSVTAIWNTATTSWGAIGDALTVTGTAAVTTGVSGSPSLLMGCCQ